MAEKTLGPEFLIHGGGLDLVFPHHENERAQSQAVGRPFAKIWMHNGLLRFTGEKMSKSVGNVATIQEVIARVGARDGAALPDDGPLAQAARVLAGDDDGRGRAGREPSQRAARRDPRRRATGMPLAARARRRLQHACSARRVPPLGPRGRARRAAPRARPSSGSARSGDAVEAPAEVVGARARAGGGARGARLRRVGSPARRDRRGRLGGARRARTASSSCRCS